MILQPAIGWVLDYRWNGALENGVRMYDINAYQSAFVPMIALSFVGALIIAFADETFCQQVNE